MDPTGTWQLLLSADQQRRGGPCTLTDVFSAVHRVTMAECRALSSQGLEQPAAACISSSSLACCLPTSTSEGLRGKLLDMLAVFVVHAGRSDEPNVDVRVSMAPEVALVVVEEKHRRWAKRYAPAIHPSDNLSDEPYFVNFTDG
eukprot:TRINITY_DN13413_c0_g1_i4.p2 TRINITY_DN13413_c0_g1~~TRINITY_DN13413_c0_g1_i4.p2  ORF type:complete len:144 (+),score=12.97 TRINITY_DN13413_c0_g1_i4:377-808(+)